MSADYPVHWLIKPLDEVMEAIIDYRGKTPQKTDRGIPLITAKVVKNGRIETPEEFIAESQYSSWMVRGLPRAGDVVVTTEAPLGEIAQLDDPNVALAQRIVTLRGKEGILNNDYLLYLMQSSYVQDQLESRASGSTVKGVKQSELRKILLPIPPEDEQVEIAKHLKALDKKVEVNRQINQSLEQMVQAIFKSWFVDFDPVRAKIAGRQPEGMDVATAALFPSEVVESELGLIPKGWVVKPLDSIAEYLNGLAMQKFPVKSEDDSLPVIKIAQLKKRSCVGADRVSSNIGSAYVVEDGDVLFSWSGSLEVDIWCGGRGALNQHLFKVTSSCYPKWFYYLWTKYHLEHFQFIAAGKAVTMGHIQRKHLTEAKCLVPDANLLDRFHTLSDLIEQQISLRLQARSLADIRDVLLPELLLGKLFVRKVSLND